MTFDTARAALAFDLRHERLDGEAEGVHGTPRVLTSGKWFRPSHDTRQCVECIPIPVISYDMQ
jgi:hypothetical protein